MALGRGVGVRRFAYRRGQSTLLFVLATLTVVACTVGPLYERAVEDATVRSTLGSASVADRGITYDLSYGVPPDSVLPPDSAAGLFETPIRTTQVPTDVQIGKYSYRTEVTNRTDQCAHVRLVVGRCPVDERQTMISTASARALGVRAGQLLTILPSHWPRPFPVLITGLYAPISIANDSYWFDRSSYSSASGQYTDESGTHIDVAFVSLSFVTRLAQQASSVPDDEPNAAIPTQTLDLPLRVDAVGIAQLSTLRSVADNLDGLKEAGGVNNVSSELPELISTIDHGRSQTRTIMIALSVQLILLALIAYGVVVAGAADQRRTELAVARLRGRRPGRAALVVVRELGGIAVLAAVPGTLLAFALVAVGAPHWLAPGVRTEWRRPVFVAAIAAVLAAVLLTWIITRRLARAPITDLLRRVPAAHTKRAGIGATEAALAAGTIAAIVAVYGNGSADTSNPLLPVLPSLLAVLAGVLAGRGFVVAAGRLGKRALARGQVVRGLAALTVARRPGHRLAVVVVCLAAALVVFAGQQWSVSTHNRDQRSLVETGAPVVLDVTTASTTALQQAVHRADPSGRYATPVVVETPPGEDATRTVAVDPASFGTVAGWGSAAATPSPDLLARLRPTGLAPIVTITATQVQLILPRFTVTPIALTEQPVFSPPIQVGLTLVLRGADRQPLEVPFPYVGVGTHTGLLLSAPVDCATGCSLVGLSLSRPAQDYRPASVSFDLGGLRVGGRTLSPGPARYWQSTTPTRPLLLAPEATTGMAVADADGRLRFTGRDDGRDTSAQYLSAPLVLPALAAGTVIRLPDSLGFVTTLAVDGASAHIRSVGTVDFVPRVGTGAILVDLAYASASGGISGTASVWLARDDPGRERALVASLERDGLTILNRSSSADVATRLARTAPAWASQLTFAVAVLASLIAAGLLILTLLNASRSRQRDLAAARLVGLPRAAAARSLGLELAMTVAVGVLLGTVVGVAVTFMTIRALPIFSEPATVPLPLSYPFSGWWLVVCIAEVVVVLGLGVALARSRTMAGAHVDVALGER